jgi:hypothetical protein
VSAFGDVFAALRTALELTGKVEAMSKTVDRLAAEVRDLDRRLLRVETIIEVTRGRRCSTPHSKRSGGGRTIR